MKLIPLTHGYFAQVDDADYGFLIKYKWHFRRGYAARNSSTAEGRGRVVFMHRVIAETPIGLETDHANGDKLDNRRCNLRVATMAENQRNRPAYRNNKSGLKGVSFHKESGKFFLMANLPEPLECAMWHVNNNAQTTCMVDIVDGSFGKLQVFI